MKINKRKRKVNGAGWKRKEGDAGYREKVTVVREGRERCQERKKGKQCGNG